VDGKLIIFSISSFKLKIDFIGYNEPIIKLKIKKKMEKILEYLKTNENIVGGSSSVRCNESGITGNGGEIREKKRDRYSSDSDTIELINNLLVEVNVNDTKNDEEGIKKVLLKPQKIKPFDVFKIIVKILCGMEIQELFFNIFIKSIKGIGFNQIDFEEHNELFSFCVLVQVYNNTEYKKGNKKIKMELLPKEYEKYMNYLKENKLEDWIAFKKGMMNDYKMIPKYVEHMNEKKEKKKKKTEKEIKKKKKENEIKNTEEKKEKSNVGANLKISNLNISVDVDILKKFFSNFGTIVSIEISRY
jgi:hypothetical protein